ncbi:MAG: hypothetical protein U5M23_01310 [Marinagarivorans sp.]|nr:hypothetical protein [Marinagarivorans sp.]
MRVIKITAGRGNGNVTRLGLVDVDGVAIDLIALGATRVEVSICGNECAALDVDFIASIISVPFGLLNVRAGEYTPKIVYFSPAIPEGSVLAGPSFETEIRLKMVC